MTVYLVGAGPGDPGLLTVRAAALLRQADVVVHDRLIDPAVLALAPPTAEVIDVGKRPGRPTAAVRDGDDAEAADAEGESSARQHEINRLLIEHGQAGRTVVRLKGGDPFLLGRGGEEAQALNAAGIDWEVVPGVSSALAVPAVAGVPVTHRGLAASVTVVAGHVGDTEATRGIDWHSLGRAGGTLVILMGVATRAEIARRLMIAGRPRETPVRVVEWGTTARQREIRTTLSALGRVEVNSPAVIVVGEVADLGLSSPGVSPLLGKKVVLTRGRDRSEELSEALKALGATVIDFPVREVRDAKDGGVALRGAVESDLSRYQFIAFTSANAVERFVPLLKHGPNLGRCKLAAVGPATAAALRRHHFIVDVVPPGHSAQKLVHAIGPPPSGGGKILFPRAANARPDLPDGLRGLGWMVDEVEAYRTVTADEPTGAMVGALSGADVVFLASPAAVRSYLELLGRPPRSTVLVCIGQSTAHALEGAGLVAHGVAVDTSVTSVVTALSESVRRAAS
jgi:uroporphyrinogen III methyltransferase/synthase